MFLFVLFFCGGGCSNKARVLLFILSLQFILSFISKVVLLYCNLDLYCNIVTDISLKRDLSQIWAPQLNIQSHGSVVFPLTFCPHFTCVRKERHPVYLSMSHNSTIMINHVQNRQNCICIQFLSAVQRHRWGNKSYIFCYISPLFLLSLSSTLNNLHRYTYWQESDSAWHASPLSFYQL